MRFLISFGMTKRECHCEHLKGAWQSHFDYNRKAVIANERNECGNPILTTTEKPSLRGNEVAVAIPLFAIHRCLNVIPHRFALRGNNFVVGL